ncbi:MAG: hypothetical protein CMJ48_09640 [Planctomycetaceae bacterium]|nr:hypothetical protein [Planctomycetaceae bacterium]
MRSWTSVCLILALSLVQSAQGDDALRYGADPRSADAPKSYFGIIGQIRNPGVYESYEAAPKLTELVDRAGGLAHKANKTISIVRDGQAALTTHYFATLKLRLHAGDLLVVESRNLDDVSVPGSTGSGSFTQGTPRERRDVQIALLNLIDRPVVLRLDRQYATLPSLLALLGQPANIATSVQGIDTSGIPRDPTGDYKQQLRTHDVLVLDASKVDRTSLPTLDEDHVYRAVPKTGPSVIDSNASGNSASRVFAQSTATSTGGSAGKTSIVSEPRPRHATDDPRADTGWGPDAEAAPHSVHLIEHDRHEANHGVHDSSAAPLPPRPEADGLPTGRKGSLAQEPPSTSDGEPARLADVAWESADESEDSSSSFSAIWPFAIPALFIILTIGWLCSRRREAKRRRREALHNGETDPLSSEPPNSAPLHLIDEAEQQEPERPAPGETRDMLQSLIDDKLSLVEELLEPPLENEFYGRPTTPVPVRLDGAHEIPAPRGRRQATRNTTVNARSAAAGVRPIMRHDVVEPEQLGGDPLPAPHFDPNLLRKRSKKKSELSANALASAATSILDRALSAVQEGDKS